MKKSEGSNQDKPSGIVLQADDTTCSECYAEFLDPEDLEVHIQQVHPSGKLFKCQFCHKTVSDALAYVEHVRDAHLLDFKACSVCCQIFTNHSDLRRHETKHPASLCEGPFGCYHCNQFFLRKTEIRQHEFEKHYNTSSGVFLDQYLPLLSSVININASSFVQSIWNEERTGKQFTYVCMCCKYTNTDLEAYVTHLKKNICRSLVCDHCGAVFKKKAGLASHLVKKDCSSVIEELCKPAKIKMKKCGKCKKDIDGCLKDHVCALSYKCSHCDSVFESMYELSEHQPKAHPLAVSLTVCKFCRKECVGNISLERHIQRTHNHELHMYKYTCTYCDTTFKHPQKLFAHFFLKHKDIEPYLCKICDKKFRVRKGFTLHIKLKHESKGFVEFDERLNVFFTDKKSEKPFQPVSKYAPEIPPETINKNKDKSQELQLANMETDANYTETEGNQTDAKISKTKSGRTVRKHKKIKKPDFVESLHKLSDYDSDDEPLLLTKKKAKLQLQLRKKPLHMKKKNKKVGKNQFTCGICKKYCYTFQNYQNHLSLHFSNESKKCIKCALSFKSKVDLQNHMANEHSSSRLTETLKNLLERKKQGEQKTEVSAAKKFLKTIKKVDIQKDDVVATLKPVNKDLSLQNFIESFTPEGEGKNKNKNIQIKNIVSLTKVTNPAGREPVIKMRKFKPAPEVNESVIKLALPVRFKKCNEVHSVTVKKVRKPVPQKIQITYECNNQYQDQYDYQDDNDYHDDNDYEDAPKETIIPEVEQEVTLEGTEEAPKRYSATHKIVIPKLPKEIKSMRIAHLLPEAPFYKIVKVEDVIKQHQKKQEQQKEEVKPTGPPPEVRLPDGTKLVHVNPLAHLLGDTPVDKIVKANKYYKPTTKNTKNFEEVLANALKKLEDGPRKSVKRRKQDISEVVIRKDIELPEKDGGEADAADDVNKEKIEAPDADTNVETVENV